MGLPIVDFCSKVFTRSLVTCFEFFLKFAKFPMKSDSRLKKLEWMGIYLSIIESRQLEIYCKQLKQTKIEIGAGFYFCRNGCVRLGPGWVEKTNRSLSKSTQLKPSPSSKEGLEVRSPHWTNSRQF